MSQYAEVKLRPDAWLWFFFDVMEERRLGSRLGSSLPKEKSPALWICGHTHHSFLHRRIGRLVICEAVNLACGEERRTASGDSRIVQTQERHFASCAREGTTFRGSG